MKHQLVCICCTFLCLFVFLGSAGEVPNSEIATVPYKGLIGNDFDLFDRPPARRSLLSDSNKPPIRLVAALDGTVHLLDLNSRKSLWSFTSGPEIYTSYQAPLDHDNDKENASGIGSGYFIDCGDDWTLYAHNRHGKLKLMRSIEEFINSTPQITEDGGIILGSKKTTAFRVDAKTGSLISAYKISDSPTTSQSNEENSFSYSATIREQGQTSFMNLKTDDMPLYITRIDYALTYFVPNSNKVLWNMTVAEFRAAFLCQEAENLVNGALSTTEASEPGLRNMPLPCQAVEVYRFRSHNMLEFFSRPNGLPEAYRDNMMLLVSTPNQILPSQPKVDNVLGFPHPPTPNVEEFLESNHNGDIHLHPLAENSVMSHEQAVKKPQSDGLIGLWFKASSFVFSVIILFLLFKLASRIVSFFNTRTVPSKRKKIRKSGRTNGIVEKEDRNTSSDLQGKHMHVEGDDKLWLNLNRPNASGIEGRTIGKLFVSHREIAKGSNGTIVLEGIYEGRLVAVKRLVKAHNDVAFQEIQNLIASDRHPNIVRWYGVEYDQDFVYLSLERCTCSLSDLIQMYSDSSEIVTKNRDMEAMTECRVRLDWRKGVIQDIRLWNAHGYPSPMLLKLMRDVVSGLVHLHELGIIHRDLKPQNVLIVKERSLCAKLSDMGISKRLVGDMSSLGHHPTGYGSSGWQAPEQLLHGRQTRAVDLFSLGCVLFFCITGGRHPFGDHLERDINITKNQVDLFLVEYIPEAVDLFSHLLDPNAEMRPKALEVFHHPLFWSPEMRLSFLRDTSDRVELEDRETGSDLLKALESMAPVALGGKWDEKMELAFINNIGRYRRYKFDSVRDLLRVMRNKSNHYRELPTEIQEILGPLPEGFDGYFTSRFPKLLIEVYKVMYWYCREEECFHRYFKSNVI